MKIQAKTVEQLKDMPICEAVLSAVSELNVFHNRNQTQMCNIKGCSGPRLYLANVEDIIDYLRNHEQCSRDNVQVCLTKLEHEDKIYSGRYGYMVF